MQPAHGAGTWKPSFTSWKGKPRSRGKWSGAFGEPGHQGMGGLDALAPETSAPGDVSHWAAAAAGFHPRWAAAPRRATGGWTAGCRYRRRRRRRGFTTGGRLRHGQRQAVGLQVAGTGGDVDADVARGAVEGGPVQGGAVGRRDRDLVAQVDGPGQGGIQLHVGEVDGARLVG